MSTPSVPSTPGVVLQRRLVEAGVLAVVVGLAMHGTLARVPVPRVVESVLLAGAWAALAAVLRRAWPMSLAIAIGVTGIVLLAVMAGPVPVLATVLVVGGAIAIGSLVADDAAVAFVVGAALIAGGGGWLLPWPVHTPWAWGGVLAMALVLRRHAVARIVRRAGDDVRVAVSQAPRAAAWAALAVALASTATWLPTLQYDDLAYHLGLPWHLLRHARYVPDVGQQVWAYAPWAGDVLQGIAQVVARAEARGPVDAAWLVACAALVARLATLLGATPRLRAVAVALFATLPPIAALAGGMQTELPAAAAMLALAVQSFAASGGGARSVRDAVRDAIAVGALAGLLAGLKLMHPIAGFAVVLLAVHRVARPAPVVGLAVTVATALFVGASSYVQAWRGCGNPVLPLFNATFRSPCFPVVDFGDARWHAVPGVPLPWSMTFLTPQHLEAFEGGFGVLLVGLAGAVVAALLQRRTRALAACALVAIVVPMEAIAYARYVVPGLVLLVPVAVAAITRCMPERRAVVLMAALCALDLAFQANAHWILRTGAVKRAVLAAGHDAPLFARYAPERLAIAQLRERFPDATVLDLGGAAHAELADRGRTTAWYAPQLHAAAQAADADPAGAAWARLLRDQRIGIVLIRDGDATPARRAGLARLGAHVVATAGPVQCWALPTATAR